MTTPTYGLTGDGFTPKTFDVIRADIDDALRAAFGSSLALGDRSILGQISAIVAERYALLWELTEAIYASQDPDKASGAALDALCLLTGTFRPQALGSTVTLTLTGTPLTVIAAASQVSAVSSLTVFSTVRLATIATLAAWAGTTAYVVGDRVTHSGNAYQCMIAGVSGGGPTTTVPGIVDGTVTWDYLGIGTGATDVDSIAVVAGPLTGTARDITHINTPVGGWSSVINVLDAAVGRDIYTDEELRPFREAELAGQGNSPQDSIYAALLKLTDTIAATVFVNNTDLTDVNSLPPHSVECLVRGQTENTDAGTAVANCLLVNVAAGVRTYGNHGVVVTDTEGNQVNIQFSRPTKINIYVGVTVTYDVTSYPTDGDAQIKLAIVTWGDGLAAGRDVVASAISAQVFKIAGVLDVVVKISTAPTPTSSGTIVIAARQLAVYDTSRITITSAPGTP